MNTLRELAKLAGLDPDYTSWKGEPTTSSDESLLAALQALAPDLGIEIARPDDAASQMAHLERARWQERVPPVVIGWDGALVVPFAVPAEIDQPWEVEVTTETGHTVRGHGRLFDLPADSHAWPGGAVHCIRRATLAVGELGYHRVQWRVGGEHGEAFAIAAPTKAFGAPGSGPKRWGVFAPVYGLASPRSGEAGDLASLRELFDAVERRGGRYVATLPILAAFLDEPCAFSPYSPASRLYWNELYLDLGALASAVGVAPPVAPPIVPGTQIDYKAQYHWRRHALDPIAEQLLASHGPEIDAWAVADDAYDYAAFRALGETTRSGWRDWPGPWRDETPVVQSRADAIAMGADARKLDTHVVAQWAMQLQLEELAKHSVHLYLDLPVGVNCDAYEVWRHRHLFMTTLAAGAPPDPLFLGGQNWGLPPLSPIAVRRDHYRYLIRSIRHHMKVAGMLRIDHVMGLFRLYCVPNGRSATDGVYVRYHADELLAILTLESQRAKCALVGEDLGTVPDQVRPAMARHGLFRIHVGQWFLPAKVGERPGDSPPESVATLNTHDTATFAGWWLGADIDDRRDLGLITDEQDARERIERATAREALLAFVKPTPTDHLTEVERAMVGATDDLARGAAEVVLVALDDLVLEHTPHNVPGTISERPNWQRRVDRWSQSLDPQRATPAAAAAIEAVATLRRG
ncbi:MAG TPA: 4-alpha-glucanotransferase [Kofleriaceae bacterium]|nr:4-alpha-glucanotransferase [Kofleriaceae bacterium]